MPSATSWCATAATADLVVPTQAALGSAVRPIVQSKADLFAFSSQFLSSVADKFGKGVVFHIAQSFSAMRDYSTTFGGVNCPGVAILDLFQSLNAWLVDNHHASTSAGDVSVLTEAEVAPRVVKPLIHQYSFEKCKEGQIELAAHPSRPRCLFCNVEQCYVDNIRTMLGVLRRAKRAVSLDDLLPALKSGPLLGFAVVTLFVVRRSHHTHVFP
jgi:hypothetical protein